jgi:hypothetical protein
MTKQKSVSIPDKQAEFVEKRGLSLSKILQNEIKQRMEQTVEVEA